MTTPKAPTQHGHAIPGMQDVNLQALKLMCELLDRDRLPNSFEMLRPVRSALLTLDEAERRRFAAIPHLLVDLNFRDVDWWRAVRSNSLRAVTIVDRASRAARPRLLALSRATLMLVWHAAQADRSRAMLMLGLSEALAVEFAGWSPDEVQRAAERQALRLKPRWTGRPETWRYWIHAVRGNDPEMLRRAHVHGLQLLGVELFRPAL